METVEVPRNRILLRLFLSEHNTFEGKPIYEQIVLKAHGLRL